MGFFSQQGKWRDLHRALFIWGVIKYFQQLVVHLIRVWVAELRTGRGSPRYGLMHGLVRQPIRRPAVFCLSRCTACGGRKAVNVIISGSHLTWSSLNWTQGR